jgi:hypothetical protein
MAVVGAVAEEEDCGSGVDFESLMESSVVLERGLRKRRLNEASLFGAIVPFE